jgi:uncharacterized protein
MLEFIGSFDLSIYQWALLVISAVFVGMGKTGVQGLNLLIVPLLAVAFGGRSSAGLLLPMLAIADVFAVYYYNRHAEWKYVLRLLPSTVLGVFLGIYVGKIISDSDFKAMMAVIVLISLAIMIWRERKMVVSALPSNWWFSGFVGLVGGFATMIGNAAGPVMAVYFLSMRLPKNVYIGTGAWFFLLVNFFKIPFHVVFWDTISLHSFTINAMLAPFILLGAFIGIVLVKRIPEKPYRIFIIVMTAIAAVRLFF